MWYNAVLKQKINSKNMEFSLENLKTLLAQSKGLHLLPDDKRQAFIDGVLAGNKELQERVFGILLKAKERVSEAEKDYNKKVAEAMEEYVEDVQILQKKTLVDLRKQAEQKEKTKEDQHMDSLLNTLNNL